MATFPLKIMTPDGVAFDGAVTSVSCRTINGQLQLLARHIDICTALGMGEAHIKLEDGTVNLAHEPLSLRELTKEIIVIVQENAAENGVSLDFDRQNSLPHPYVYGSPLHLRQIFLNICSNCIKYNKPGGSITTRLREVSRTADTAAYAFTIRDTGIGIPEEEQGRIFGRFYRGGAVRAEEGVGIGLYLVREILRRQGGYVKVASRPGQGTTFSLYLPRE